MKLNELFEAGSKHVTFCFGRMNPPTIGHKQLLDTMASVGGEYKIFLSQTQDRKKNPLDYSTKIKFVKEMFPKHAKNIVEDSNLNTVVKVASYLFDQGYTDATFVAGSDRLEDMKKLLEQYNGVEGKAHGYYKFEVLDFVSSGDREDGAEGVKGVSASNARAAAAGGDFKAFEESTGAGGLAKSLYAAVRNGMGINESFDNLDSIMNDIEKKFDQYSTWYFIVDKLTGKKLKSIDPVDSLGKAKEIQKDYNLAGKTKIVMRKQKGRTMPSKNIDIEEAPIEMDPSEPMNPMIHSHDKANPGKLKYRMMRAAGQIKDLAARVDKASPSEWQTMTRQFDELKMNMEQIRHALEELAKMRKKGGVRSRGIDPMLDDINEGYGRYYCSTDKKWKTRKGPKQSRKS